MDKQLTSDWSDWIKLNIERGCDKDGIFKILLDEGFSRDQIMAEMNYEPVVDPASIVNPLAAVAERTQDGEGFSRKIALDSDKIYLPNSRKLISDLAEFYLLDTFLEEGECERLIALIRSRLRVSEIAATRTGEVSYRTSNTCDLGLLDDPLVRDIDRRICSMIGIDASYSEVIQGQYYSVGQQFKEHTDYFEADQFEQYAAARGQRTYTFFVYLNDVEAGGETEFLQLGVKIKPKSGRALIWNNLTPQGIPNHNTMHQAHPVLAGYKCVITKWFRANGSGPMYTKEANEFIPNYTATGFKKSRVDPKLYERIYAFYQKNLEQAQDETVPGGFIHGTDPHQAASSVMELPDELRNEIHASLTDELSEWSDAILVPTYVYGIRIYRRGAVLKMHRDRSQTHIISAIINVAQETDNPWPLFIEDNYYRMHRIYLDPGEVVYYEGARLTHGRPEAFDGNRFANIFCHYQPQNFTVARVDR
jgi:prolyl 4-hydroxylase